ncbi:MAG: indolepyruvate oxidoreductase subunit beta [Thermoplasmata archaeon]|nr:indolepyruvate oxidoreductase subunit beta [Thermoplasmata archaeon]
MKTSILFAGVGGQGVITAASIVANAALKDGYNVVMSELHGMAQRGGDVKCAVRIGDVLSPIIPPGTAKAIVALEPLEALRNIEAISKDGLVITDINPIYPPLTSIGIGRYPTLEEIFGEIEKHCKLIKIDANEIARKAGNILTKNVVMLGALHSLEVLPIKRESIIEAIKELLHKHAEINIKAFEMGEKSV